MALKAGGTRSFRSWSGNNLVNTSYAGDILRKESCAYLYCIVTEFHEQEIKLYTSYVTPLLDLV